jgi:hypothetical protein
MIVTRVMGQFEWLFSLFFPLKPVMLVQRWSTTMYHRLAPGAVPQPQSQVPAILALGNNTEHVISYEMPVEIAS